MWYAYIALSFCWQNDCLTRFAVFISLLGNQLCSILSLVMFLIWNCVNVYMIWYIIPQCVFFSGGVGRTGVFISVWNSIERLKAKNVVDVFQSVRSLRVQRTAMVQTIVSLIHLYCHSAFWTTHRVCQVFVVVISLKRIFLGSLRLFRNTSSSF